MYDITVLQKATVPAVDNQHIQIFYNKIHFSYLLSYTNVRKGHPRVTEACTCLVFFFKHITIQSEDCSWGKLHRCKKLLAPSVCAIIPSHWTKSLLFICRQENSSLKWKPHRDELLSTVHLRNGYLETQSAFANTLSSSAGSRTYVKMYWPMKNKEHS
jgi:hypothetical protein